MPYKDLKLIEPVLSLFALVLIVAASMLMRFKRLGCKHPAVEIGLGVLLGVVAFAAATAYFGDLIGLAAGCATALFSSAIYSTLQRQIRFREAIFEAKAAKDAGVSRDEVAKIIEEQRNKTQH